MKSLLKEATDTRDPRRREELLATIRAEIAAHERMEEQVFYPVLQQHDAARPVVLEGFEEHHVVDVILDELMEVASASDVWAAKMKVLKENVEHHIEEEEDEMFEKARQAIGDAQLEEIGQRMADVKGE